MNEIQPKIVETLEDLVNGIRPEDTIRQAAPMSLAAVLSAMRYAPECDRVVYPTGIGVQLFFYHDATVTAYWDKKGFERALNYAWETFESGDQSGILPHYERTKKEILALYEVSNPNVLKEFSEAQLLDRLREAGRVLIEFWHSTIPCEVLDEEHIFDICTSVSSDRAKELSEYAGLATKMSSAAEINKLLCVNNDGDHDYDSQWCHSTYQDVPLLEQVSRHREEAIRSDGGCDEVFKKYEESSHEAIENKEKLSAYLQSINSKEQRAVRFAQELIHMREVRREFFQKVITIRLNVVRELLSRTSTDLSLALHVMDEDFETDVYKSGEYERVLRERGEGVGIAVGSDVYSVLSTNDIDSLEKTYRSGGEMHGGVVHGKTAMSGKAAGVVWVVHDPQRAENFAEGDILVTSMTRPEFIPLMKKAGAVVTDEGGITCHAAIVSRELKVPCIIGTKVATQVLNNGDMVKVDADKGVVHIVSKHKKHE